MNPPAAGAAVIVPAKIRPARMERYNLIVNISASKTLLVAFFDKTMNKSRIRALSLLISHGDVHR